MKMKQLIVTVELLEHDVDNFPKIVLPDVIYKASRLYLDEDAEAAIEATKYLCKHIKLKEKERLQLCLPLKIKSANI